MDRPTLQEIKVGWAAIGDGWAVHARTQEEALRLYAEAEEKHRHLERQPYLYEQKGTRAPNYE